MFRQLLPEPVGPIQPLTVVPVRLFPAVRRVKNRRLYRSACFVVT
jgi:hypothetical protein